MASIEKRVLHDGGVSYLARVRMAGFPERVATFDKERKAKAWAAKLETDYREGKYQDEAEAKRHTAGEMIDRYVRNVLYVKSQKRRYVEQQHKQLLWWKGKIGKYALCNLTSYVLAGYRDELVTEGKKAGTVNRYLAAFSHVLNTCIKEWGWIRENPLAKVMRMKEPRGRVRFLSDKEREALMFSCRKQEDKPLFLIVMLALATGARKGELLGARLEDVDVKRGMIVVHETKNKERRTLFVSGYVLQLLKEYMGKIRRKHVLLFATRNRQPMCVDIEFRKAVKTARVKDFRFHDLRHTFASYMAMNGASLAEIAEALGHKTLNMVKRYAHLCKGHMAKVIEDMTNKMIGAEV